MKCRSNSRCTRNSLCKKLSRSEAPLLNHKSNKCSNWKSNSNWTIAKCLNHKSSNKREFLSLLRRLFQTTLGTNTKFHKARTTQQQNCIENLLKYRHGRTMVQIYQAIITGQFTLLFTMKKEIRETKISFINCPQQVWEDCHSFERLKPNLFINSHHH